MAGLFDRESYMKRIERAAEMIREADYVLLGAGAGMSAAAGAEYGGENFKKHFGEFIAKYGDSPYMRDMYSAGFYPYPDWESFWGFWSKYALLMGEDLDITPLHRELLDALSTKKVFCISTNVDGQFVKAGMKEEDIFCVQGDYSHIQCARACHNKLYNAVDVFRKMQAEVKDCKIPSELIPVCPVCGAPMRMNLREDDSFVQDDNWYEACNRYSDFVHEALESGKNFCMIELGVGFDTPAIIRYPFENTVKAHPNAYLVRLNYGDAEVPLSAHNRAVGIDADMKMSINDIIACGLE